VLVRELGDFVEMETGHISKPTPQMLKELPYSPVTLEVAQSLCSTLCVLHLDALLAVK